MKDRIIGFDLARAYAIFGMFIVNFNFSFGSFEDDSQLGRFLNLFVGNSTAIFIICAGMGVSLMTNNPSGLTAEKKKKFRSTIIKRSWFLFAIGLLLYNWWPGDILHFYGGYLHIATFILFVPKKYYLLGAILAIIVFHALLFFIPIEISWDFQTFRYTDFWSVKGFFRNTFYNGWNSIFPWIAYFLLGMWLGRVNWQSPGIRSRIFVTALVFFLLFEGFRRYAVYKQFDRQILDYIMAEYFPPYLPFMVITASFALIVITVAIWLGERFARYKLIQWISETGKMTLTHYVFHLTVGMLAFQNLTGKKYTGLLQMQTPSSPWYILIYSIIFFIVCMVFSFMWRKRFQKGPLETLMRKISD